MFKYYITKIVRKLLKLLYIFPVKCNRVLFYSFSGKDFSDSPKYISEFMQKLMIAAEVLVSDYSSCIWDFSLMFKPCFLYVPDLKKYDQTFAFYTPIYSWGFSVCESNGELVASVRRFDRKSYIDSVKENHKLFGNAETGAAIEYVYKYIVETN